MTYSVVACDAETGTFGVGVQSCVLAVGTRVPFARHGVGAAAVQAGSEIWHAHAALDLLERGADAEAALTGLVEVAEEDDVQFGIVDRHGGAAAYTGPGCAPEAGHALGAGVAVQGNVLAGPRVWERMLDAYEGADGELPDRLLATLWAAEAEGGDIRGRQSAALLVASPDPYEEHTYHWPDGPVIDLRVDDHEEPLEELGRLLRVKRAHDHLIRGAQKAAEDWPAAAADLERGAELAPDDPLLGFWRTLSALLDATPTERGRLVEDAVSRDPWFSVRVRRLSEAEAIDHSAMTHLVELLGAEEDGC